MEKDMHRVLCFRKGSMKAVPTSGMSCKSESAITAKPGIDDPSKSCPVVKKSSSTDFAGTLKWCCPPIKSVNRMSTKTTASSLIYDRTSWGYVIIVTPFHCVQDGSSLTIFINTLKF